MGRKKVKVKGIWKTDDRLTKEEIVTYIFNTIRRGKTVYPLQLEVEEIEDE